MAQDSIAALGVCYYPEHWPRESWRDHAALMRAVGITLVRVGEFAWSRIEPSREQFDWAWLDEALAVLAEAGLDIVLCTPTACPPRWLIEEHPDILPVDAQGRRREFGSRRHYRFASRRYREESRRITTAILERYAAHPAIVGWQTDNEYGCHDTTLSYSDGDGRAFQSWLQSKYASIDALNAAWGTVFWSQEYRAFSEVDPGNLTVTEANPAQRLDFWRFASEQVRDFNREQVTLLRETDRNNGREERWITHNLMGNFTDFDHFALGKDLDIASWDSYPLGFLDQGWFSEEEKQRYRQIGHPDWAAFHHDLYRAVGDGRLAVMEQQPGPVNWAPSNALPLRNAPAFWGMEAIAHGAEFVSYFRFQQLPRAQEQMHAALRLPNGEPAPAWEPVRTLAEEIALLPAEPVRQAQVAVLFDYPSCWATRIQPHAPGADSLRSAFGFYSALREFGLDVDFVSLDSQLTGYAILIVPGTVFVDEAFVERTIAAGVHCLLAARSGSRDHSGALPQALAPAAWQTLLPLRVTAVDSMRPGASRGFEFAGDNFRASRWFEVIESEIAPRIVCEDGLGLWYSRGNHHYLNAHVPTSFLHHVLREMLDSCNLPVAQLPAGLRQRRRGRLRFVFNFSPSAHTVESKGARQLVGTGTLQQGDYAVWLYD